MAVFPATSSGTLTSPAGAPWPPRVWASEPTATHNGSQADLSLVQWPRPAGRPTRYRSKRRDRQSVRGSGQLRALRRDVIRWMYVASSGKAGGYRPSAVDQPCLGRLTPLLPHSRDAVTPPRA